MVDADVLRPLLALTLDGVDIPELGERTRGKVRDMYRRRRAGRDERIIVTTDRLSAFDRVLGEVPYKGQVLNQLTSFWFDRTADVIGNHRIDIPDPNVCVAHECEALPVEVVVRGYITGSTKTALWHRYSLGEREVYGHHFPEGLKKNEQLPEPIITPTTKAGPGGHDERLTCEEVVSNGLLDRATWDGVQRAALEIFRRGQTVAAEVGLILVDTKYEFGRLPGGKVVLIDEVHTPDSSRYWVAGSYPGRFAAGEEPENFDKDLVRAWYVERNYRGDGEPPPWNADLAIAASMRYQKVYEMLTGKRFEPAAYPAQPRIRAALIAA